MPNSIPIIPFVPQSYANKENEKGKEKICNKNEDENLDKNKIMPNPLIQTSIFTNKNPKDFHKKFENRKMRPFRERSGDWICQQCRNLNFAFRNECNRCKLPKKEAMETKNKTDNKSKNQKENNVSENNTFYNRNMYLNNNILNIYINSNEKKNNSYKNSYIYNNENKIFKNKDCSNNYEEK